ncbi:DUF5134 domain-containing protein [Streptomyces rhizosphaericus]|uniref:DUF5134 domain-containing protein n=1 Tax=Streptomyces rhizosphaericus TaxID=114699 RepID=A0A6G4ATW6_9ACTN|nr:DUF5134 domain-containing protein [Streptomyces rhizosphaericus]NEW76805.1 DUF5134 domain-containing protein [Streptomyces rhizosphaericus]
MHGPPLIGWLLVALCAATGGYCLSQMRGEPPGPGRRIAGAEALMGWGMAVMAVPSTVLDPRPWGPPAFVAVFAVAAVRALLPVPHGVGPPGHRLHHTVGALAMVYMALAMMVGTTGGHHHTGETVPGRMAGGVPLLTGVLLVYFAVYVVRSGLRLVPMTDGAVDAAGAGPPGAGWSRRPELRHACRLSMGIGMFAMLLTL